MKNKKDEINNATNISSEEKTDLIKQATEAANIAKDNINNATTNSEVETAQVDGEKAIADVTVPGLSDIKKESIDLINKALNEKQDEINNASNLSQDEKQELIDQAKKVATEAINEINNARTNDEAKEAADTGVKNIENVSIPSIEDAKKNASRIVNNALIEAEKTQRETETLRRNIITFKRRLKSILENQLDMVDDIDHFNL